MTPPLHFTFTVFNKFQDRTVSWQKNKSTKSFERTLAVIVYFFTLNSLIKLPLPDIRDRARFYYCLLTNVSSNKVRQKEYNYYNKTIKVSYFETARFLFLTCGFVFSWVICSFSIVFSLEKCSKILASEATKERLPINIAGTTVLSCVYLFNFFSFLHFFFHK